MLMVSSHSGSDYSNRPEKNDDKALEGHNGPLRGNGQADGKCGNYTFKLTDPKPKFPPGEDAKGQGGKPNEIGCAIVEGLKANREDMDAAIEEYCNNDGHDLSGFKGDKKVGGVHIHVQGSVRTRGEAEWYEDVGTCRYVLCTPLRSKDKADVLATQGLQQ